MKAPQSSLPDSYFDSIYRIDRDPWRYETSAYERQKYEMTIGALKQRRFLRGLEIGCSIGVLTQQLASHCAALISTDVSEEALRHARVRCAGTSNVEIRRMRAPHEWPDGFFDLIVLSEVLYYLSEQDVDLTARRVLSSLEPGGLVILVHWTGETDYPLSGDRAAELFAQAVQAELGKPNLVVKEKQYRMETFQRGQRT